MHGLQVGKQVYGKDVEIELVKEEVVFDMNIVTFNLRFDNQAFMNEDLAMIRDEQRLPLKASIFKDIFPFCIIFGYIRLFFFISSHCVFTSVDVEFLSNKIMVLLL